MATRTCRVGVHGRNQEDFSDLDYQVIREANLEVVKMMSQTKPEVFERIKRENPNIEIITRLYDDRINAGGHPTPQEFASKMIPIMRALRPYCTKFQVHNEPNHMHRIEGWGKEDADAESFNRWFLKAYELLKVAHPWASIGFPGLAIPHFIHRDRAWLRICRPAIIRADWLGVHCYWQTPPDRKSVILDPAFGLTFKHYHKQFPTKTLEILECGNSNVQSAWHRNWAIPDDRVADEYVKWLHEVFKYDYINSASFFILSSQDAVNWGFFSWRTEGGWKKPVVHRIGQMHRPPLGRPPAPTPRPPAPKPRPKPKPAPPQPPAPPAEPGKWTNQQVITAFARASSKLGLGNWTLMGRAGIKLADLVRDRGGPYQGPAIEQLPRLTEEQKALILQELDLLTRPKPVSFGPGEGPGFLWEQTDLVAASMTLPSAERIRLADAQTPIEKRAARAWNRYGYLLLQVADTLEINPGVAVAVLAAQADRRGIARNGRLVIRFEPHIFYDKWGKENIEGFERHFRFNPKLPWQKHQWRPSAEEPWRDFHHSQAAEWEAFEFAYTLDERAAKLSTGMGLARMMGFNHAEAGYEAAEQMFDAFTSSERYQVLAVFDLIAGRRARSRQLKALRARDLEAYAALHYGSRQAARYASMLQNLFEAFERLKPIG